MTKWNVPAGSYQLGPADGSVEIRTSRVGMASRAGHDLTIAVTRWTASVTVPAAGVEQATVTASLEVSSFEVREAAGGVKPFTEKDGREVVRTVNDKILQTGRHPTIDFRSTQAELDGDAGRLSGDLTIMGVTRPVVLRLTATEQDEGVRVAGQATVTQSAYGIKPYTAFFGALKLRDDVEVAVDLVLRIPR